MPTTTLQKKSKLQTVLLAFLFGSVGAHRFYLKGGRDFWAWSQVLAMVLGSKAEAAFRQSLLMSDGSLLIFWSNPLAGSIMTLGVLMLAWPLISKVIGLRSFWRRAQKNPANG